MAGYIKDKIVEVMPNLGEALAEYNINPTDMIRFRMVSDRCRTERNKKGLSLKQISIDLKIAQYRLKMLKMPV